MGNSSTIRPDTTDRHVHKYTNKNPIHRLILGRFLDAFSREILMINPKNVLEFGCGEGLLIQRLKKRGVRFSDFVGIDLRRDAIESAKGLHPELSFECVDIFEWNVAIKKFDLVIVSQVLEHLPEPGNYMERIVELGNSYVIFSVPLEPWFRIMNLLRGRDVMRLGNHPEHINHWSLNSFVKFVGCYCKVKKAYTVFPFIVIVAEIN